MPDQASLLTEDDPAGFRWLRLNRPHRRNALDVPLARALLGALRTDQDIPVLLASTDPAIFCAGADLTVPAAERAAVSDLVYDICAAMLLRPAPVIAVLTGPAVGGGAQLAAAADLRVAGPGARLRWSGPPDAPLVIGAWLLPDLLGRAVAMDLLLTGRWLTADEAQRLGFVSRLTDDPGQEAAALIESLTVAPRLKQVASHGLLDRLQAEREANRRTWKQASRD